MSIKEELFKAAGRRILELGEEGVTRGRDDISEPECRHSPDLINMEEYEDWTKEAKEYSMDRRLKKEKRDFVGEKIEIEEIQKDVTTRDGGTKKCRHVMVIGAAGMGKTTLLTRMAQDGTLGNLKDLKDKLVIMADVRAFSKDEKMLPSQALLGKVLADWDDEKIEEGYQWIINNSDKVVFIVDSLDTLPFDLENERTRINYYESATVDTILHNLLAGDLFQKSSIISSSREYKVRNLHPSVRPDRCVLLDGLKEESVKDLIDGFVGKEKGNEVRHHINTECPNIWPLLSIPVFLVFSVIGIVKDGFKPKTMSGILVKIFVTLIDSNHARSEKIKVVLGKLMPLSFEGIKKGRVLFSPKHLRIFNLKPEEVTDLGILIPQGHGNYLTSKLMQNDNFYLYFNHQTEQECLAALHVLSLNKKEFEESVEKYLYQPNFSVVRRIVCGILLNNEVLELTLKRLTKIPEAEEKKAFLIKSLGNAIKQQQKEYHKGKLLELLIDLNEAKDGVNGLIRSSLKKIDLDHIRLSRSDVQAVACVMKRCEHLDEVSLSDCNLDEEKIDILHRTILSSNLQVHALYIGVNDLGEKGMFQLAELAKHCQVKVLGLFGCKLDTKRVKAFLEGASDLKLSKLYVSNNTSIGIEGMFLLGKLILNCAPDELGLRQCNLKSEHLEKFTQGALNAKLRKLDVSVNTELGPEGMLFLGNIIRNREIRDVGAAGCNLKPEHVQSLVDGLGSAKVRSLDLNDYSNKPYFSRSLLDLLPHVEKELNLRHWQINEKQQEELQEKLNEIPMSALTIFLDNKKLKATSLSSTSEVLRSGANIDAEKNPSIVPDRFFEEEKRIQRFRGGEMELGCCKVKIAPGCLEHDANIKSSVQIITPPDQPKKCVAISPVFRCDLSHARLVPGFEVDVEMQVYCFAQEKVPVVLLEKPSGSEKWVEIKELKLSRNRKLKFKISKSFYGFIAFKRGTGMGWVMTFPVVPRLYCNKFGMFKSVLCLDEEKMIKSLDDSHNSAGFASVSGVLEPVIAKFGDSIGVELQTALPSIFTFGDDDNHCDFVTDEVLKQIYVQGDFTLRNIPDVIENQIIKVLFTIEKGRPVPKQRTYSCKLSWPLFSEAQETCQPSIRDIVAQTMKENLTRSISAARVIGTKGGIIRLQGCKAKFSENQFDSDTTVSVAMRPQNADVPEGHKSLSPILKCSTSNVKFKGQATITLPVYYNMDNGNIVILSKKDSQHDWETVKVLTSLKGESVTFEVGHFTRFGIFEKVRSKFRGKTIFLHNSLYFNTSFSSLCGLTCIKDKAIKAECNNTLKVAGYCHAVTPRPENIRLKQGQQMRFKVECTDPEQSEFDPDEETICAASTFEHSESEFHYFTLKPTPKTDVSVKYTLTRPGEPLKRSVFKAERNVAQSPQLEDVDATASVSEVQVRGSPENIYTEHMHEGTVYRLERDRCKGRVLIINNGFDGTREGSDVDVNNMKSLWTALRFEIVHKANLNAEELQHTCANFASETRNVSVVVVIIMTHGGRGDDGKDFFEGEDKCTVLVEDIIRVFTSSGSPHLQNIPKVFIFQSCRGAKQDCRGSQQDDRYQVDARGGGGEKIFLPGRADILISFATQPEFTSVRHKTEGSWFINAITNVFMRHAHDTHVLDMFIMVNDAVSKKSNEQNWIQISNQDNSLTKKLFLYPGWPQL